MATTDDVQALIKRLRRYHRGEAPHEAADTIERLLADRDAQVREAVERAFKAGMATRPLTNGEWAFPPLSVMTDRFQRQATAALAAYLTRQPAAGARTEEQKP